MAGFCAVAGGCSNVNELVSDLGTGHVSDNAKVFTIGSAKANVSEMKVYILNYKNIYGKAYDVDVSLQSDKEESFEKYVKDMSLSSLERAKALSLMAKDEGISLSEEEENKASQCGKDYLESLSEDEKAYIGGSEDEFIQLYEDYALSCKMYDSIAEKTNIEVSDDDARVMRIRQIFVSDEKSARKVKKALNDDNAFLNVAVSYSELKPIEDTLYRGQLPEEVENEAYSLSDDEWTDAIEANGGYYFIYCVDDKDKALTKQNKTDLSKSRLDEAVEEKCKEFYEENALTVEEEVLNEIDFPSGDGYDSDTFFSLYE